MKSIAVALAILACALLFPVGAEAHAHLIRADLAPNSHLKVSVGTVRFLFDEPLDGALSRIVILNAAGRQVNADTGELNPTNPEELDLTVPTLPDGVYSVRWTSDSAQDGHVMHGFYLFTVGGPGAVPVGTAPALVAAADGAVLDTGGLVVALAHWLVLLGTVAWTGALALDTLVLAPARRQVPGGATHLSIAAGTRIVRLVQTGLAVTVVASVVEVEAQGFAAGGAWSGPIAAAAVGSILASPYGLLLLVRLALVAVTIVLVGLVADNWTAWRPLRRGTVTLGIVALRQRDAPTRPLGLVASRVLGGCGLAYLLALALSGHAAALPHMQLTAAVLDWLHLICAGVWIGGMAALALTLLPVRDRAWELLDLLDRFSPAAYLALLGAAATGMFNVQVRLDGLAALTGTLYGRLLLVKLALIGAVVALSASHVFWLRPRLRAQAPGDNQARRGYAALQRRLRLEPALGAAILLCVAVMGQAAPRAAAFDATVVDVINQGTAPVSGGPIAMTTSTSNGALGVTLQISPADVGQARLVAAVTERGRRVGDGQVQIKLSMPATPDLGTAAVATTPGEGGYTGTGDLVQEGLWRADVLVRTRDDPMEFRDVPFVFVAGPEPAFLAAPSLDTRYGPAAVRLQGPPGGGATLQARLRPGLRVRYLITMADMSPQSGDLAAGPGGWYRGVVVPPMEGYMNLAIQVRQGEAWRTARMLVCNVTGNLQMRVLE